MDRSHRGPAGPARTGGAPVSANLAVGAASGAGNIVEARDLVKSFGSTPALRGASLTVRRGEIVAVMGPSGSGKSTLLHCLAGILVPEQGEVWFGGQRLDTLGDDRRSALRRDRFGFVFQSGQLVPELTAEQNVALPLLLSGTRRGPAMTAARKWFPALGLDGLEGHRSGELSGGQAQRVALARGLVAGPAGAVRRRADRVAGLGVWRAGDGPAQSSGPRARHHRRPGHPRRPGRRLRRPRGRRPRRHGQHPHRGQAMIGLGLRLVISGGREAITRLAVLAVAVGLGVGLLLTAVAATNAVTTWNNRHAWYWTGTSPRCHRTAAALAPLSWRPAATSSSAGQSFRSTWPPPAPRLRCRGACHGTRDPDVCASPHARRAAARHPRSSSPAAGPAAWPRSSATPRAAHHRLARHHRRAQPGAAGASAGQRAGGVDLRQELGWPVPRTKAETQGLTYEPLDPKARASAINLVFFSR